MKVEAFTKILVLCLGENALCVVVSYSLAIAFYFC